jgi:hypothetical protein
MNEMQYLTFDSLTEGVGASQALAYVRKIALNRPINIISFEKEMPSPALIADVISENLRWTPLEFGRYGLFGGISRVIRMCWRLDSKKVTHARGNLAALAALLRSPKYWIWDCRSLHADQRRALSSSKKRTLSFLAMGLIEHLLAKRSTSIIVITKSVIPVFISRFKIAKDKMTMIPTCVDTERFVVRQRSEDSYIKILLPGTFSPAYDVELMQKIITKLRQGRKVWVTVATSVGATNAWKSFDYDSLVSVSHREMPNLVAENDLGMSIWKNDLGICLTSVASTKVAEFLACGRPVLVNSLQGDIGKLVQEYSLGVSTQGSSDIEIENYVNEIIKLLKDPQTEKRCRAIAEEQFNLNRAVQLLLGIYDSFNTKKF